MSILFSLIGFSKITIKNININLLFNENIAFKHLENQINLNKTSYRIPGTKGREECAKYFISEFKKIDPNFTFIIHNFSIQGIECQNLLFKLNEKKPNILILGAHYDTRAKATKDPIIEKRNLPVPGANDGASGCAVLLELARVLFSRRLNLSVQVWFTFFDAEDQGYDLDHGMNGWDWCEGSNKFVQDIASFYNNSEEYFEAMILLDMVGGTSLQFIAEQYSTSSLLNEIFEIGRQLGHVKEFPQFPISASIIDDHVPFSNLGIPTADLIINFWNNPDWPYHHTTNDDLNNVVNRSLGITGKTIEQFVCNNYYNSNYNNYKGNRPWKVDVYVMDSDLFLFLIIVLPVVGVSIVVLITIKYRRRKEQIN